MNGIKSKGKGKALVTYKNYKPKNISLKQKASNLVHYLFDISFDFSQINYEEEILIYNEGYKITAKITHSQNIHISSENNGFFQISNGNVIDRKGNYSFDGANINVQIGDSDCNLSILAKNLTLKLESATYNGKVSFSFSPFKIEIAVTFINPNLIFVDKEDSDGTIIFTITPNIIIPMAVPVKEAEYDKVIAAGVIVTGVIIAIKIIKGCTGFFAGGPLGFLIGVSA